MCSAERVVFAFGSFGETGQAATLSNGADAVAPPGQDLVRIGLVTDIPDQSVMRRVENVMQCHGQLYDTEAGAEVTAGNGYGIDQLGAQLVGKLPQVLFRQPAQIGGNIDPIKQRRPIGDRTRRFWIQRALLRYGA